MHVMKEVSKDWAAIHDLSNPDVLCKVVPRLMGYNEVAKDLGDMIATDTNSIGKFTRVSGFSSNGNMQRIGWIPIELYSVIEGLSPGFFSNRKNRDRFLKENKQFDLRRKAH